MKKLKEYVLTNGLCKKNPKSFVSRFQFDLINLVAEIAEKSKSSDVNTSELIEKIKSSRATLNKKAEELNGQSDYVYYCCYLDILKAMAMPTLDEKFLTNLDSMYTEKGCQHRKPLERVKGYGARRKYDGESDEHLDEPELP